MVTAQAEPAVQAPAPPARRLGGLDGIRGVAALFVVLHHCYLLSYPGYPAITGPAWTGWLIFGHLAVVVFIVLSGFSLAVSPARHEWQLGGKKRFAIRRAWRILPPYWAALTFSLLMAWTTTPIHNDGVPNAKSVIVHGLLLQDIIGSATPNGAFWSIAVEAQLYIVFPVLVLMMRKAHALAMLAAVTAVTIAVGVFAPGVPGLDKLMHLTPQFAALFAAGVFAAGILAARERWHRVAWHWLALAAVVPVLVLMAVKGSVWTVEHYFWIDILFGPATAMLLAAVATGRPHWLVHFLDTRPMRSLGSFSYSLYLIHAPIVIFLFERVVSSRVPSGVPTLLVTLALAVPASVIAARLFAAIFEIPFQRHRGWNALRAAIRARLQRWRWIRTSEGSGITGG